MDKTIYTREYGLFLEMLRKAREQAGLTQEQAAERLESTQSFVSKCERGERRLDVVELAWWCKALGVSFSEFARKYEKATDGRKKR